jgi:hypothetical protein
MLTPTQYAAAIVHINECLDDGTEIPETLIDQVVEYEDYYYPIKVSWWVGVKCHLHSRWVNLKRWLFDILNRKNDAKNN